MRNRLIERLKRLEVELKPQTITEIPPAAQEVIDRMMQWKTPKAPEQFDEKSERNGHGGV
jgi:hypothetical protein